MVTGWLCVRSLLISSMELKISEHSSSSSDLMSYPKVTIKTLDCISSLSPEMAMYEPEHHPINLSRNSTAHQPTRIATRTYTDAYSAGFLLARRFSLDLLYSVTQPRIIKSRGKHTDELSLCVNYRSLIVSRYKFKDENWGVGTQTCRLACHHPNPKERVAQVSFCRSAALTALYSDDEESSLHTCGDLSLFGVWIPPGSYDQTLGPGAILGI